MIQTYTSDHHLTISIEGHLVKSQYKGNKEVSGFADDYCCGYIGLVFEDLNRQHNNVDKLKAALREAMEDIQSWGDCASDYEQKKHKLGEEIERYKQIIRGCN